jgi:hypothetical protein
MESLRYSHHLGAFDRAGNSHHHSRPTIRGELVGKDTRTHCLLVIRDSHTSHLCVSATRSHGPVVLHASSPAQRRVRRGQMDSLSPNWHPMSTTASKHDMSLPSFHLFLFGWYRSSQVPFSLPPTLNVTHSYMYVVRLIHKCMASALHDFYIFHWYICGDSNDGHPRNALCD